MSQQPSKKLPMMDFRPSKCICKSGIDFFDRERVSRYEKQMRKVACVYNCTTGGFWRTWRYDFQSVHNTMLFSVRALGAHFCLQPDEQPEYITLRATSLPRMNFMLFVVVQVSSDLSVMIQTTILGEKKSANISTNVNRAQNKGEKGHQVDTYSLYIVML